ncbi:MAG: 50S ribosomal protein L2 [Candidatus Kariarchaeaceae archaeon]|jgi:large subunit ribosomal protein L2
MGKKIIVQRRGKGSSVFRAAGHKRLEPIKYRKISKLEYESTFSGEVLELTHEPGRGAPLAKVKFEDGLQKLIIPAEGISVGSKIHYGVTAEIKEGNVLPMLAIPIRTPVFNIELRKGDGGKLVRTGGGFAIVDSKEDKWVIVKLPSGRFKRISPEARASIGVVAGGGRTGKPFLKAGAKYHAKHAKGQKYPRVRGTAMNPVKHPHGGGAHQSPPRSTTVSRDTPPGRKVGLIAARRTGYKRGRQTLTEKDREID